MPRKKNKLTSTAANDGVAKLKSVRMFPRADEVSGEININLISAETWDYLFMPMSFLPKRLQGKFQPLLGFWVTARFDFGPKCPLPDPAKITI